MSRKRRRLKRQRRRDRDNDTNRRMKVSKKDRKKQRKERKKLKEEGEQYKSSTVRSRSPAGYKNFKEREAALSTTPTSKPAVPKKKDSGNKTWRMGKAEQAGHDRNIKATEDATKKLQNYKPSELNVQRNEYKDTLPPRPNVPKLPKITTPGGDLKVTRVNRPSGLSQVAGYQGDKDNRYDSKPDYSKVYKHLKPGTGENPNRKNVRKPKVISGGPKQVSRKPITRK